MESAVVDLLVGKISSIIENEASLIRGVHNELDELKLELIIMKSFLQDADKMNGLSEREKTWVASVTDMCYPVEDIIDEFMYHMNKKLKDGKSPKFLNRIIHLPKNLWMRHRLAKKIQEINRKLKSIPERNQRYGVPIIAGTKSDDDRDHDQRRAQNQGEALVYAKADHVVGIDDDERLLEEWLTKGERERTIISIVGMGGSGKSTLAAKVYNSPIVKRSFECCAWITVSQTYEIDDLLKSMIKEFHGSQKVGVPVDLSSLRYKGLLELIIDYLGPKRYVVVLDDVWDVNLWRDIKSSLPDEGHGSRVILTTRDEKIAAASFGVGSHIHRIKPLKQKEAWELFCTTAFVSNPNRACPQELKHIAHDLLLKCEGLPLAILALGGALSSKMEVPEWVHFSSSLNYELSNNDELEEVKKRILLFSFKNLSYQLKRCFLYCCIFPEDYPIQRNRLIKLWVAEGFVEQVRSKTPELMADDYLMELIQRNMLQVVRNASGRPKTCKMHDMMRELALSMSEKEKFCFVSDGQEEMSRSTRRLSIQNTMGKDKKISFNCKISRLRSLFVFVSDMVKPSSPAAISPYGFRLLRVLDLKGFPIDKLPDELMNLFNLRYLNLKRTNVKELPKSIGDLRNLQTLDTRHSKIEELPSGIVKLENLRHLLTYRHYEAPFQLINTLGTPAPSNIYKLKNLQVLDCVEAELGLMKELKNMTQLTRIGITKVRKEDEEDLCTAIRGMNLLNNLVLMATNEDEILRINALPSAPPCLETLILFGKLEKVPSWFHSLQSLTYLYLRWSRLSEDPIPHIQTLANLGQLVLSNAYTGDQLCFSAGFNKLTILNIEILPQLKNIIIKKGVMPGLLTMILFNCMELKMVPHGIEHLTELQELHITHVSTQLVDRLRGEESVDRPKVRQIPKINHYYDTSNGLAIESLSRFDLYEGLNN